MLTEEDDVEIHALARRGWSVSAIARHTGRDRKTVSKYLAGPHVRSPTGRLRQLDGLRAPAATIIVAERRRSTGS